MPELDDALEYARICESLGAYHPVVVMQYSQQRVHNK